MFGFVLSVIMAQYFKIHIDFIGDSVFWGWVRLVKNVIRRNGTDRTDRLAPGPPFATETWGPEIYDIRYTIDAMKGVAA